MKVYRQTADLVDHWLVRQTWSRNVDVHVNDVEQKGDVRRSR